MTDASSDGWVRSGYMVARSATSDAKITATRVPEVLINVRHPGAAPDSKEVVRGRAVLGSLRVISA